MICVKWIEEKFSPKLSLEEERQADDECFRTHFEAARRGGGMSLLSYPNIVMFCCVEDVPVSGNQKEERVTLRNIAK